MIKIRKDIETCEGYANCVVAASDVYDLDDDG
ncbi:MAG: ferredoxin, partial [Pseudonocardiaceae bacterium]|nr:ferredoxin [Pseudonocardiaceae bacterium]